MNLFFYEINVAFTILKIVSHIYLLQTDLQLIKKHEKTPTHNEHIRNKESSIDKKLFNVEKI